MLQPLPLGRAAEREIALIRELGVGDCHIPEQAVQRGAGIHIDGGCQSRGNEAVHHRVDAAHEEAGDAAHPRRVTAGVNEFGQAVDVRARHFLVALDAEQQGDVDVDTLAGQLPDGGQALPGRWHLDHHVRAIDCLPQATRVRDGAFGIVREVWRDLQAHVPIRACRFVVHRAKQVRGVANVANRERLVQGHRLGIGAALDLLENLQVIRAAGDRLFENRGIRCGTAQPVFGDQPLELAAREQAAAEVIQPDRLTEPLQGPDAICGGRLCGVGRRRWCTDGSCRGMTHD